MILTKYLNEKSYFRLKNGFFLEFSKNVCYYFYNTIKSLISYWILINPVQYKEGTSKFAANLDS